MSEFFNKSSKPSWAWLRESPTRMIAFGLGSGLAPFAPGTIGTLWAWAIGLIFFYGLELSPFESSIGLVAGFVIGVWVCGVTGQDLGHPDHGGMVWDEIIAFWIIMTFVMPTSFWMQLLAFAIFRWLDAAKPGPIQVIDQYFKTWQAHSRFEQKWELYIRGFGVMIDDIAAALATLVLLSVIYRVFL